MGLFDFVREAGEKLFGTASAQAASAPDAAAANAAAATAIHDYICALELAPADLAIAFDGANSAVTVSGTAPNQSSKEKILLAAGNVAGVAKVADMMTVARSEPEAQFHTVVRGDSLSAIARKFYGDAS